MQSLIINQIEFFLIYIVMGIIISSLFDFFRSSRKIFRTSDLLTYIEDVLFWILSTVIIFVMIFVVNKGQIRNYFVLGIALGIIIYILYLSKICITIDTKILAFIKMIFEKIIKAFNIIFRLF